MRLSPKVRSGLPGFRMPRASWISTSRTKPPTAFLRKTIFALTSPSLWTLRLRKVRVVSAKRPVTICSTMLRA